VSDARDKHLKLVRAERRRRREQRLERHLRGLERDVALALLDERRRARGLPPLGRDEEGAPVLPVDASGAAVPLEAELVEAPSGLQLDVAALSQVPVGPEVALSDDDEYAAWALDYSDLLPAPIVTRRRVDLDNAPPALPAADAADVAADAPAAAPAAPAGEPEHPLRVGLITLEELDDEVALHGPGRRRKWARSSAEPFTIVREGQTVVVPEHMHEDILGKLRAWRAAHRTAPRPREAWERVDPLGDSSADEAHAEHLDATEAARRAAWVTEGLGAALPSYRIRIPRRDIIRAAPPAPPPRARYDESDQRKRSRGVAPDAEAGMEEDYHEPKRTRVPTRPPMRPVVAEVAALLAQAGYLDYQVDEAVATCGQQGMSPEETAGHLRLLLHAGRAFLMPTSARTLMPAAVPAIAEAGRVKNKVPAEFAALRCLQQLLSLPDVYHPALDNALQRAVDLRRATLVYRARFEHALVQEGLGGRGISVDDALNVGAWLPAADGRRQWTVLSGATAAAVLGPAQQQVEQARLRCKAELAVVQTVQRDLTSMPALLPASAQPVVYTLAAHLVAACPDMYQDWARPHDDNPFPRLDGFRQWAYGLNIPTTSRLAQLRKEAAAAYIAQRRDARQAFFSRVAVGGPEAAGEPAQGAGRGMRLRMPMGRPDAGLPAMQHQQQHQHQQQLPQQQPQQQPQQPMSLSLPFSHAQKLQTQPLPLPHQHQQQQQQSQPSLPLPQPLSSLAPQQPAFPGYLQPHMQPQQLLAQHKPHQSLTLPHQQQQHQQPQQQHQQQQQQPQQQQQQQQLPPQLQQRPLQQPHSQLPGLQHPFPPRAAGLSAEQRAWVLSRVEQLQDPRQQQQVRPMLLSDEGMATLYRMFTQQGRPQ
jgi:hypothetical protein